MKKIQIYIFLTALVCISNVFSACEDEDNNSPKTPDSTEEWITNFLKTEYLWSDEVASKTPDNSSPENLFYSLLSLKDGKTKNGSHYYYSYIENNSTTKSINEESTYGFEFVLYNIVDNAEQPLGYYYARILYTLPGSPADSAGLKRGDWITKIAKQEITSNNYKELMGGAATKLSILKNMAIGQREEEVAIKASIPMDENPLLLDTILNVNNKNVGYLVYNHFKTGKGENTSDQTYDNEMIEIFKKFKNEKVSEFVLDLRYNGGGYLSSAQLLAGFLVPENNKDGIFCYLEDNKGKKEAYKFRNANYNLGLSRVFILVSNQTASASEAVINGLKPYMDVILIGNTTEGKNVGSIHETHNEWAIQPIVSRIYNKDNSTDYENGFTPEDKFFCNELNSSENNALRPLGDQREYMLSKALDVIKGDAPKKALASRSTIQRMKIEYNSIERKQENAVHIR